MATRHKRNQTDSLALLGILVIVLLMGTMWRFSIDDVMVGSFQLDEIQICEELDDDLKPIKNERNMPGDVQQVCLWFSYSRARDGDSLEISWYLDEKLIQREKLRLSSPSGVRAFYLLKEDGSPLDTGFYSILLTCNGSEKGLENFTVSALSDDYFYQGDDYLDY
ncbi:MAG: hypothetical protein LBQ58_08400 [Synergistaceae bacterium]|jgi:hypothetical protein|nr:hypothetical protein [Synergistaceae bacterium]